MDYHPAIGAVEPAAAVHSNAHLRQYFS